MHNRKIGILVSSPLVAEGLRALLHSSANISLSVGPWQEDIDEIPEIVITDIFRIDEVPVGCVTIGLVGGSFPSSFISRFNDTVSVYDPTDEILRKIDMLSTSDSSENLADELSPREKEVILLVVKGLANKEIASQMNVSVNTVMTHRRNIASKLKIHSPAGLTIFALATGLVKMEDITD